MPRKKPAAKSKKKNVKPEANVSKKGIHPPWNMEPAIVPYFQQIVEDLEERGMNSSSFYFVVKSLATTLYFLQIAEEDLHTEGIVLTGPKGGVVSNPAVGVYNALSDKVQKLSASLGMTPKDRAYTYPVEGGAGEEENPRDKIFRPSITISANIKNL